MDSQLHMVQIRILRELLFKPTARFSDLNITNLTNDHFTFHIKRLLDQGLVTKNANTYLLTHSGKEYANRLDTEQLVLEKQAKVSIKPVIVKKQGPKLLFLAQQRLKQPYYGLWGFPGGKIRWGETLFESAERELLEETGLTGKMSFKGVQHKLDVTKQDHTLLEDKFFYVIRVDNPQGKFIESSPGCLNRWCTRSEIEKLERFDGVDEILEMIINPGMHFVERNYVYDHKQY